MKYYWQERFDCPHREFKIRATIVATFFGKTKTTMATLYNMPSSLDEPEEYVYISNDEDYCVLFSPQLKGKRIAVVTREDWLQSEPLG